MSAPPSHGPRVELPTLETVEAARKRISPHVLRSPLVPLNVSQDDQDKADGDEKLEIYLKLENLQHTGCFKARGAFNALLSCDTGECKGRGVVTSSAGNFGQGLSWCARNLGCGCTVVAPDSAPETKVEALERYGANVVKVTFADWWTCLETHRVEGMADKIFVHPCADNNVIAGNGTIALEILEDLPDVDAVIVPYGGGGMCCGVGAVMKAKRPECKVYPVEVSTSTPLLAAWEAGKPTPCQHTPTFVDGIGGKSVLDNMWPLVTAVAERPLTVSLEDVAEAIRTMCQRNHVVAEGAGAAPVAAALKGLAGRGKVVAVVSGGNINVSVLAAILQGQIPSAGASS